MSPRRVLVVRVGAMGDVLHALPAVTALRRAEPDAEIGWVVDSRWAPLLVDETGNAPVVSRVHLAETRLWSRAPMSEATLESVLALRRALRSERFGQVVDMQGTLRSAVIGWFAGSKARAGFADPRESAARWLYSERLQRRGAHVVEQGAALLGEALGVALQPAMPDLPRSPAAEGWAELRLAEHARRSGEVLLAPTAGWGAKQWPADRFAELARELALRGFTVLVNAAHAEESACAAVVRAAGGAASLVVCNVAELIALTRRVAVVVGGDSGPVHLAAALGRPVVALYGPTDPARNGPWGPGPKRVLRDPASPTSHRRVAQVDPGLAGIAVEQVMDAVLAVVS